MLRERVPKGECSKGKRSAAQYSDQISSMKRGNLLERGSKRAWRNVGAVKSKMYAGYWNVISF